MFPSPALAGSGWPKAYSALFRLAWELSISLSQHRACRYRPSRDSA
jgi:hypothetical protein